VTNAWFATLHGLKVGPVSLPPPPVPLLKPRARHERNRFNAAKATGFRLRLGGGVALQLRSRRLSAFAPLSPLSDRRPKPRQTAAELEALLPAILDKSFKREI